MLKSVYSNVTTVNLKILQLRVALNALVPKHCQEEM